MRLARLLAGGRFLLTVTSIDHDTEPVTVEGLRLIERANTDLELTYGQAAALGLPGGQGYRVTGMLIDRAGHPARVPAVEAVRVPARWLCPPSHPRLQRATHRDADLWPYM